MKDVVALRSNITGSLASGSATQKSFDAAYSGVKDFTGLTLPYHSEESKIRNKPKNENLNNPTFWKQILQNKQAELQLEKKDN